MSEFVLRATDLDNVVINVGNVANMPIRKK